MSKKMMFLAPRILSILFIVFLMLFSLDVFEIEDVWYNLLLGFLMHNIPAFILIIILIFSWKKPIIGTFMFTLAGIFYAVFVFIKSGFEGIGSVLTLSLPSMIIGLLFLLSHYKNR